MYAQVWLNIMYPALMYPQSTCIYPCRHTMTALSTMSEAGEEEAFVHPSFTTHPPGETSHINHQVWVTPQFTPTPEPLSISAYSSNFYFSICCHSYIHLQPFTCTHKYNAVSQSIHVYIHINSPKSKLELSTRRIELTVQKGIKGVTIVQCTI